jgi:hypothetical protein
MSTSKTSKNTAPDSSTGTKVNVLRGLHRIFYYEYPTGNRAYGGGGWSSRARHRPAPVLTIKETKNPALSGKSVLFDGIRKLKCTIVRCRDGAVLREDYPLDRITRELLTRQSETPLEAPIHAEAPPAFGDIQRKIMT